MAGISQNTFLMAVDICAEELDVDRQEFLDRVRDACDRKRKIWADLADLAEARAVALAEREARAAELAAERLKLKHQGTQVPERVSA
jgi:hypothetical protein